jgi:nucleotide-binding universal stress UspA family protein
MNRLTRALCPVDFSDVSQHALDHAAAIAHWYQAQLTLLHVFVTRPTMDAPPLVLEDADLLVFGSTTHHVIRAATCQVLIAA